MAEVAVADAEGNGMTAALGLGIGWRPELALAIERRSDLGFVEVIAEDFDPLTPLPRPLRKLQERGVVIIPHGVTLSLGGADPPDAERLEHLHTMARWCGAPLVSEHLAFVRAEGLESGHLLPLARTEASLAVLVDNIRIAQQALRIPLAVENIATLVNWPEADLDEATFLRRLLEQVDVQLLLDVENLHANAWNHGGDPLALLDQIPLNRIAYVHVAGGVERNGIYHDTHAHPVPRPVLELLEAVCARVPVPGVMLERDDRFPGERELHRELDAIAEAVARGTARREHGHVLA